MVAEIRGGSITSMSGLAKRPVYFLHLHGSTDVSVVVKGESASGNDFEEALIWGRKIMRNVNGESAKVKIMSAQEIEVFKGKARTVFDEGTPQAEALSAPGITWVKLDYIANLQDAETRDTEDKNDVTKVLFRFKDKAFWKELGQVVAVDIFIGNNDRFDTNGKFVNQGNVMFAPGGKSGRDRVLGLDNFDTGSRGQEKYFAKSGTGGYEALRVLVDSALRSEYADKCTADTGKQLERSALRLQIKGLYARDKQGEVMYSVPTEGISKLFLEYSPEFAKGIEEGAKHIKKYLREKLSQYKKDPNKAVPIGITERMTFLGWL